MIYIALFLFGVMAGSFAGATIWRLKKQGAGFEDEKPAKKSKSKPKKQANYSIVSGRSMCEHCQHELAAKDLIPLISWLSLNGKCRYCHKSIGAFAPIIELAVAGLFMLSYFVLSSQSDYQLTNGRHQLLFVIWLVIITLLAILFVYDYKFMRLPNRVIYPLIILGVIYRLAEAMLIESSINPLTEGLFGGVALGGLFYLLFAASGGKWIGGGDVKLGFFIGLLLGPLMAFLALFLASLIGSIVILAFTATKRVKFNQPTPFGPYLIAVTYVTFLWGQSMIDWYSDTFLLIGI